MLLLSSSATSFLLDNVGKYSDFPSMATPMNRRLLPFRGFFLRGSAIQSSSPTTTPAEGDGVSGDEHSSSYVALAFLQSLSSAAKP